MSRSRCLAALFVLPVAGMFLTLTSKAQVASAGAYTLDQVVIAGGGGSSAGGSYAVDGTAGQSLLGSSNGPGYSLRGGFWVQAPLAPSAASATISGRVLRENGIGLKGVRVVLSGGTLTAPQTSLTSSLGYFTFEEIDVGRSYMLSVSSGKYGFAEGTRVFTLMDNLTDIVFEATWTNP